MIIVVVQGTYFDGRRAAARPVAVEIAEGRVRVHGDGVDVDVVLDAVVITDPLGRTPRQLRFPDGGFCEVETLEEAELERALLAARGPGSAVSRWERSGRVAIVSVIAITIAAVLFYHYGLPRLADRVARNLPAQVVDTIGDSALSALDDVVFEPSAVPESRQRTLRIAFANLQLPGAGQPRTLQIEFRKSEALGPNALALPSGQIVMTDELVALAARDEELLGILAHEAGHVAARHGLRGLLQSSAVALLVTWYVGDVGTVAAAAPTALLNAKYSRDFERDADAYAAETLQLNGISLTHLADILERMTKGQAEGRVLAYVSSHPMTTERSERLRGR